MVLLFLMVVMMWLFVKSLFSTPGEQALAAVDEFYQYEQKGDFAKSWELFHPFMKDKFQKGAYLQDRAHVFMNHFGVESFSYTLGEPEELERWQPAGEGPELKLVYKVPVTQVYKGKYGNFALQQEVFAVQEKEDWLILWNYNQ